MYKENSKLLVGGFGRFCFKNIMFNVEAFLAHKIKKKMPKTAKKLLKTAPKHEIFLKEYTVSYYY